MDTNYMRFGPGGLPVFDPTKILFQANPATLGNALFDSSYGPKPCIFQIKNMSLVPICVLWFKWVFKTGPGSPARYNPPPAEAFTLVSAYAGNVGPVIAPDSAWHTLDGFGVTTWLDGNGVGSTYRYTGTATITEVCAITDDPQLGVTPASYAAFTAKQNLAEAFKWQPNADIAFDFSYFYGG